MSDSIEAQLAAFDAANADEVGRRRRALVRRLRGYIRDGWVTYDPDKVQLTAIGAAIERAGLYGWGGSA